MRIELLYNHGDELVGAVLWGHVDAWVARALAHDSERLSETDEVWDWAGAEVLHQWWQEPDDSDDWQFAGSDSPGQGLTPCTYLKL